MISTTLRTFATAVRKHPLAGPVLRLPFVGARRAGVLLPARLYRHLWFEGPISVRLPDGGEFAMYCYGDTIENSYYWAGITGHERECVLPWIQLSRSARVVLDIGANTGAYSLMSSAANSEAIVHAFEPLARVAAKAKLNAEMNPSFRITVHQLAVSASSGVAMLSDPGGDNCYSASLDPNFLPGATGRYEVPVTSIDDFVDRECLTAVDLVKIDVEGVEEFVLAGMSRTIDQHRPSMLIEYLERQRGSLQREIAALCGKGYALFHLSNEGVMRASGVGPSNASRNVVLIPEERTESLASILC